MMPVSLEKSIVYIKWDRHKTALVEEEKLDDVAEMPASDLMETMASTSVLM